MWKPSTGDKEIYGEFLVNAQGEDVVAGIRTPQPLSIDHKDKNNGKYISTLISLKKSNSLKGFRI